jgi:hypothetical protein
VLFDVRRFFWVVSFNLTALFFGLALTACASPAATPTRAFVMPPTQTPAIAVAVLSASPTPVWITPWSPAVTSTPVVVTLPAQILAGQHLSASGSYTATEDQAAGPMYCRIERDSCAFGALVAADLPGVIFVRAAPPYADEVTLMHANMIRPLTRLQALVETEWGGEIKLLVTAAYDSQGQHDLMENDPSRKYSLHFEGRSIDLALSSTAADKLARLCGLALQSGFDWVHNEGNHCHASVNAASLCFVCSSKNAP